MHSLNTAYNIGRVLAKNTKHGLIYISVVAPDPFEALQELRITHNLRDLVSGIDFRQYFELEDVSEADPFLRKCRYPLIEAYYFDETGEMTMTNLPFSEYGID
jgi:hypothetical protein